MLLSLTYPVLRWSKSKLTDSNKRASVTLHCWAHEQSFSEVWVKLHWRFCLVSKICIHTFGEAYGIISQLRVVYLQLRSVFQVSQTDHCTTTNYSFFFSWQHLWVHISWTKQQCQCNSVQCQVICPWHRWFHSKAECFQAKDYHLHATNGHVNDYSQTFWSNYTATGSQVLIQEQLLLSHSLDCFNERVQWSLIGNLAWKKERKQQQIIPPSCYGLFNVSSSHSQVSCERRSALQFMKPTAAVEGDRGCSVAWRTAGEHGQHVSSFIL